jgi:hypothetical protein
MTVTDFAALACKPRLSVTVTLTVKSLDPAVTKTLALVPAGEPSTYH